MTPQLCVTRTAASGICGVMCTFFGDLCVWLWTKTWAVEEYQETWAAYDICWVWSVPYAHLV